MHKFDDLWPTRRRRHLLKQGKYLQYVFNDHLMIALIFLAGALAYWYSQRLRLITTPVWWGPLVLLPILLLSLTIGRLTTLLRPADQVFLLPAEHELRSYLNHARIYSLLVPFIAILAIVGVLTPFALRATWINWWNWLLVLVALLRLKDVQLSIQLAERYDFEPSLKRQWEFIFWSFSTVGILVGVYGWGWLFALLTLVASIFAQVWLAHQLVSRHLLWQNAIAQESQRQSVINRFYNLFVDIPGISGKIKRRRWLDGVLKLIAGKNSTAYQYLYSRALIRRTEYGNIWLRFCIVSLLLIFVIRQPVILLLILLIFLFLTGYQLLPLYHHYDHHALTQIYPIDPHKQRHAFSKLLRQTLLVEWGLDSMALVISFQGQLWGWLIIVAALIVVVGFTQAYLPFRLQRKQKGN